MRVVVTKYRNPVEVSSPDFHTIIMSFLKRNALVLSALVGLSQIDIAAADIVQSTYNSGAAINAHFGQSFTATINEPAVSAVGFAWYGANLSFPDPTMTATLYDGFGFGGSVLGTSNTYSVPDSYPDGDWVDFVFSPNVALTSGNTYSIRFSYAGSGVQSGGIYTHNVAGGDAGSAYVGGVRLDASGADIGAPTVSSDLMFRVLAGSVPEPTTLGLLAAGALIALRRKR
ncbi:MAG TPA: PEP-CTERM sorting domain-containing protein [Tepidisphaeraceae bacterium]|nr:PEP-CTERM sorting domain-containing protein [Tepidisphaeraceae bacterium]